MFGSIKPRFGLAAIVGVSAAVVVGLAAPASAETDENQAIAFTADGPVVAGPIAQANFPSGPPNDSVASAYIPNLLEGITDDGHSETIAVTAGATSASASLNNVVILVGNDRHMAFVLASPLISSGCSYDADSGVLTGTTSFADVSTFNGPGNPAPRAVYPSPPINTTEQLYGLDGAPSPGTVTFNRQVINPDGSLTVDAFYAELTDGQTITVATSHCHAAVLAVPVIVVPPPTVPVVGVPPVPVAQLPATGSDVPGLIGVGLGTLILGFGIVSFTRRRTLG